MTGLAVRLLVIRRARHLMAGRAEALAAAAARPEATAADILVSEVLPLLAACRFLERRAAAILAPRAPGGRPLWLAGTTLVVRRVPLGRVLVIAPSNYPLLLPAVHAIQALVAGNIVWIVPAPGCAAPMLALRDTLVEAGLDPSALRVLDDTPAAARAAITDGVDHVVLTGSAPTGRAVLADLAPRLVPATLELSGRDAMIVLAGADLEVAARAAAFGLRLNAGRTCIAPRRMLVEAPVADEFARRVRGVLGEGGPLPLAPRQRERVAALLGGGALDGAAMRPCVLDAAGHEAWLNEDLFAPLAALTVVADAAAAVVAANAGPYALGATVFGPGKAAARVAAALRAGCVLVNDMIAPTAHPALPFGGTGDSGFGVTRGADGLLAMTRAQAVVTRARPTARHLTLLPPDAAGAIAAFLRLYYGSGKGRALRDLAAALGRLRRRR